MSEMEQRWYAIQTTAGHENKVRSLIQRKIEIDSRPAEDRQALINSGRQRVQECFAWPVVAAQTVDLFRAAVAHRRGVTSSMQVAPSPAV